MNVEQQSSPGGKIGSGWLAAAPAPALLWLAAIGNAGTGRFSNTRNFEVHPIISFAVFPLGQDYHLAHHVFPLVPHFNLRKTHRLLMAIEDYRNEGVLVAGYFLPSERPPTHPTVLDLMSQPTPR